MLNIQIFPSILFGKHLFSFNENKKGFIIDPGNWNRNGNRNFAKFYRK